MLRSCPASSRGGAESAEEEVLSPLPSASPRLRVKPCLGSRGAAPCRNGRVVDYLPDRRGGADAESVASEIESGQSVLSGSEVEDSDSVWSNPTAAIPSMLEPSTKFPPPLGE